MIPNIKFSQYLRICVRCNKPFHTNAQRAKVCDKCYKPMGGKAHPKIK